MGVGVVGQHLIGDVILDKREGSDPEREINVACNLIQRKREGEREREGEK